MKRLLGITLAVASLGFALPAAEAKTNELSLGNMTVAAGAGAQWQREGNRRGNRRSRRVVTRTRVVRHGRHVYRETYQVIYRPNGTTDTRLISRVRIA